VDATTQNSYTIELLSPGTVYYVRVSCINDAGYGTTQTSSPSSAYPGLQIPGMPQTITAQGGVDPGEIDVTWLYPRIAHHGIPCSGTVDDPEDCPAPFGGTLSESTGGDAIQVYEVEYNEFEDFTGQDGGLSTTDGTSMTLEGLTSGRKYYIRVLARNSVGSGAFCEHTGTNCPSTGSAISATATA